MDVPPSDAHPQSEKQADYLYQLDVQLLYSKQLFTTYLE